MGSQETGQPLSQGRAQAPPAILALDWLLTKLAALGLRKSSFRDTWIVLVRRVVLGGVVAGSELEYYPAAFLFIPLPGSLLVCRALHG